MFGVFFLPYRSQQRRADDYIAVYTFIFIFYIFRFFFFGPKVFF
uniref:Uncharacterized protein n=1 Tax=Anguilla anguilla TaxID=7936 RepID=A0A0E9SLE6_ANGAN